MPWSALRDIPGAVADTPARCAKCGDPAADMGLDWKAPAKDDAAAWTTLVTLYEVGETFHTCGCSGPGYRPRKAAHLRAFLEERRRWYAAQLTEASRGGAAQGTRDGVETWRERLVSIDAAIARLR